ncbi:DNA-formamidopyrimidine glycosylase [Desulfothermobacter acidiphilus]|uniref:DNA-formamidopyrimidine glycosylase n=1 Tax=Desulfothermobacter acidiphilus TaxID=1938353 RepID=UPI003F8BB416
MPELPEVETIRRQLASQIVGSTVEEVRFFTSPPPWDFRPLLGRRVIGVHRRGKWLWLELEKGLALLLHLGMTGQLVWETEPAPLPAHTHLVLRLGRGQLRFTDPRRFGRVELLDKESLQQRLEKRLGPEPLSPAFSVDYLTGVLARSRRSLKSLLLDQKIVAGLGNIYADEALFAAGIDPRRQAFTLTPQEIHRLHRAIREVLAEGLAHRGTSFRDYVDAGGVPGAHRLFLRVYGREGQPCPRCGRPINKIKVAGRGTHFCSHCQR